MPDTIKALSILQPWPFAIFHMMKTCENRSWFTSYRGPLLIHAGQSTRLLESGCAQIGRILGTTPEFVRKFNFRPDSYGAFQGVVDLTGCDYVEAMRAAHERQAAEYASQRRMTIVLADQWAEGPYCWWLANPRLLPAPVPYKGRLGLFDVPVADVPGLAELLAVSPSP